VHILATSREPLRVKGERVHRLSPLTGPPAWSQLTAVDALAFPAIQLFVERAVESLEGFELSDADAPIVAEICHKLEGIALAIELAATRIDAFGLRQLSALLEDRFRLLRQGRRTALARHRTLAAALDWSYEILPEYECTILRRLGVFAGPFTLASASAVLVDSGIAAPNVVEGVANLVAKSLVSADVSGAVAHYRLLDTTRAYALDKLKEAGEDEQVARVRAEFFRDKFVAAAIGRPRHPSVAEMHEYGREIDNVRSAIDWSFSNGGEPAIGVALTAAFSPVWLSLSLMAELRDRAQHALRMKDVDSELSDPRERAEHELDLRMALGPALVATKLHGHPDIGQTYARAWELCQQLGDHSRGFTALRGLQVYHQNLLEMEKAQHFAEEALRVAERLDDPARLVGGHMPVGATLYWQGKLEPALAQFRRGFELFDPDTQFPDWPGSHPGLQCQLFPMLISWMLGYPARSLDELRAVVESAETLGHPVTLTRARCHAALVHSFRHEASAVADHAERALRICEERRIESLRGLAVCANGCALGVSGESEKGLAQIAQGLDSYGLGVSQHALLALQADVQLAIGKPEAALASVAAGLEAVEGLGEGRLKPNSIGSSAKPCSPAPGR
jgi:predicted ATPase